MKVVLIGFMGSGKTSIAKGLAQKLGLKFIDMDEMILNSSGMKSINEIFDQKGEKTFREVELETAQKLKDKANVVISTGGGVVGSEHTMQSLSHNAHVIYLKLSFENAAKRVSQKKLRPPLFQDIEKAKKLFEAREPLYEKYADIIIDTDNISLDEVLNQIEVKLGKGINGR